MQSPVAAPAPVASPIVDAPSPARRSWAKRTAILGFLVLVMTLGFFILPGVRQAGEICGRAPDMLAFELVRSVDDVNAIFANTTPGCRDGMARAMNQINRIDLPFYILIYSAFMVSAALFESAKSKQRRWLWGLLAAAIAVLGDFLETGILLQMTDDLADPGEWIGPLIFSTWLKWLALGGFAGLVAVLTLQQSPRRWLIGLINLLAALVTLLALFMPAKFGGLMGVALFAGWIALWVDSLRSVFLKR